MRPSAPSTPPNTDSTQLPSLPPMLAVSSDPSWGKTALLSRNVMIFIRKLTRHPLSSFPCSGYYCGKVGRVLTVRLARRNGGISEPEHVLYVFIASVFLVPFAMILYGLAVTYHLHWFALVVTQVAIATNGTLCVSAALGYAMSSYPELSGQMVTTCVLIRNTLSFAINYGITPWLNASGYLRVYCTVGGIGLAWNASLFAMARYGRKLREGTAARYYRDVEYARAKGLSH